jgi:hypothetical protein
VGWMLMESFFFVIMKSLTAVWAVEQDELACLYLFPYQFSVCCSLLLLAGACGLHVACVM